MNVLGNRSLGRFDAIVVGSGSGGAPVAWALAAHGWNVLVLEAGPNRFAGLDDPRATPVALFSNDELKLARRRFVDPDPAVEPRTFRPTAQDGPRTFIGDVNTLPQHVGGAAVHADVKTPRFTPQDFGLGTRLGEVPGASFADWPIDYDALEPFYAHAERMLGVQGLAGSHPFEPPRRAAADYPMPPGTPMYASLRLAEGAAKLGHHPFPYPTAVNSRPYDGRPPCVDCGFCGGYGCPSHAKGSPAVTYLRRALLTGRVLLRAQTRAVRLVAPRSGSEVVGVEAIGPDGGRETFRADRYVLAASPIEDARLLWLSGSGGRPLGDSSGLVGRHLMFHHQTVAVGVFDERLHGHRGRTVTHGLCDFRGVAGRTPLGGIVELGAGTGPIAEALNYARGLGLRGTRLKAMIRQSPLRDRLAALTMQGEDAPQPTNRVDLDPDVRDLDGLPVARVTYASHAFELAAREAYAPRLLDVLETAGARYAFVAPREDVPTTRHVMGTLRMGCDPRASVCRPDGRLHDVGNLWASDGAIFPTSSGFNPILTIAALATRVAGEMLSPGAAERVIAPFAG